MQTDNTIQIAMRPPPAGIPVGWHTPMTVLLPRLYRYEDEQWIDRFFATGELRLSLFSQFAKYDDPALGDTQEGRGLSEGVTSDNAFYMVSMSQGHNAYVFCTSTILAKNLRSLFKRNSAFVIDNPTAFAHEIARQIPGLAHVLVSPCEYRNRMVIQRNISAPAMKENERTLDTVAQMANAAGGPELMFLKRAHYAYQCEYRLMWLVDERCHEPLSVKAPNARQFCRRVSDEDYINFVVPSEPL